MASAFQPVSWALSTNIYEVNIRQYTEEGTLNAFAAHLPRLKDMGVETLWFMPLQPIGKLNRKGTLGSYYSISDHISLNPEFGSIEDFKLLVEGAHHLDMKVIIDWVANHTAWDHVWTKKYPEFFSKDENGNFRPPYPDWADVIHLNYDNKQLWFVMVDAMRFWVDSFDIDGFRCDMAHLVPLEFWKYARTELDNNKKLFWLAETEDPNYHEAFDATYTWEFLHAMEAFCRRETGIYGLDAVLHRYENSYPPNAIRMFFTSNHDENSHSGSEYERMGDAAVCFAVFCTLWQGIPLIYSGQELPNKQRLKFFEKDTIRWTDVCELHGFYRRLLDLDKLHPAMKTGDDQCNTYRISTSDGGRIFSFIRKNGNAEVLVFLNLSSDIEVVFFISDERVQGEFRNVFTNDLVNFSVDRNLRMNAWNFLIYQK